MASVYVSYRRNEQPFVQAVMSPLEPRHDVRIDYKAPVGTDWRSPSSTSCARRKAAESELMASVVELVRAHFGRALVVGTLRSESPGLLNERIGTEPPIVSSDVIDQPTEAA